jgi:hypothetical protein
MTLLSHRRNPNAEIGAGVDHQPHTAQHFGCVIAQAHTAKRGDRAAGAVACAAQLPKNMGHSLELSCPIIWIEESNVRLDRVSSSTSSKARGWLEMNCSAPEQDLLTPW